MLIDMSQNVSPTVTGGLIPFVFPAFERVLAAVVYYDASVNLSGDFSNAIDISVNVGPGTGVPGDMAATNPNQVDIYPYIRQLGIRTAAVTANLAGHKFTVFVKGE